MAQFNYFNNVDYGFPPQNIAGNAIENGDVPLAIEAQEIERRNEPVGNNHYGLILPGYVMKFKYCKSSSQCIQY
ncbi:unnamed protein product [Rotaria socialis]|uniref:Uncharacterized protein n=1 Tax=Rotaria socialis TaxID=392032 RepID=A0A818YZX1_9BILA|nr:unnamed protein product [Rotaria socialis]